MKELSDWLREIGAPPYEGEISKINNRRYTVPMSLSSVIVKRDRLVYAGRLLGRTRREFEPGSRFLQEVSSIEGVKKVWVENAVGWLFVCGRDIFEESLVRFDGELCEGETYLVMLGEDCLGYGRFIAAEGKRIIRNIFDIGDFLRRERDLDQKDRD